MKSIIYKSLVLLAVGSFLSCKKDAAQHTCAVNSLTQGSTTYNYTYDAQGRVIGITGGSNITITYGSSNSITINTTTNGTTQTAVGTLNSNGSLVSLTSPSYTYQMTYDNNNRLLSLYVTAGGASFETVTYAYNTNGDMMAANVSNNTGTLLSININNWDTNANVGHFEPILYPDVSLYKLYGNFSNHLPTAFTNNGSNYSIVYSLNSNGYIDSMTSVGGGSTTNSTFNMTCN